MKKMNSQSWKRQSETSKRISLAVILVLIVLMAVGCKGRHWDGGHGDDGYGRDGGHGCSSPFVELSEAVFQPHMNDCLKGSVDGFTIVNLNGHGDAALNFDMADGHSVDKDIMGNYSGAGMAEYL